MQIPDLYQPIIGALQNQALQYSSGKADKCTLDKDNLLIKVAKIVFEKEVEEIEKLSDKELKTKLEGRLGGEIKLYTNGFRYDWALSGLKQSGYVDNPSGEWELTEKGRKVEKLTEEKIQNIYGKATSPNLKVLRKKLVAENLKALREKLMVDVDDEIKGTISGWHTNYKGMVYKVYGMRQRLLKNDSKLSAKNDKEFLKELISNKKHGITTPGKSFLSKENFGNLIINENFLNELTHFIINPSEHGFQKLRVSWKEAVGQDGRLHHLLINRIAAACTLDVSSVANHKDFLQLFRKLIEEKIIDKPSFDIKDGKEKWFSYNLFLIAQMREIFEEELDSHTVDEIGLNQFVWYLYAYSIER